MITITTSSGTLYFLERPTLDLLRQILAENPLGDLKITLEIPAQELRKLLDHPIANLIIGGLS
jgi:uncharacterized protein (UPF0216 family)